jgi:uncharacterized delta-60 repeat protein
MAENTEGEGGVQCLTRRKRRTALERRGWALGLVAALLLGLSWAGMGYGAPGDLDPTFGTGGISVTFGPQDGVRAVVVQPEGKLVVAGTSSTSASPSATPTILLVRYLSDGRGDPAFGSGGKMTTLVGSFSLASALVLQPDGKLLMGGRASVGVFSPDTPAGIDLLLARFLPDGQLDTSFGAGGIVTTDFGASEEATDLVLEPDGTIVVMGLSTEQSPFGVPFLVRYQVDGRLDATFGSGGRVSDLFPGGLRAGAATRRQARGSRACPEFWPERVTPTT